MSPPRTNARQRPQRPSAERIVEMRAEAERVRAEFTSAKIRVERELENIARIKLKIKELERRAPKENVFQQHSEETANLILAEEDYQKARARFELAARALREHKR